MFDIIRKLDNMKSIDNLEEFHFMELKALMVDRNSNLTGNILRTIIGQYCGIFTLEIEKFGGEIICNNTVFMDYLAMNIKNNAMDELDYIDNVGIST